MPKAVLGTILGLLLILCASTGITASEDIQGQRTLPVVADTFKFVPGSWATYDLYDLKENTHSQVYFFIDKREIKKKDKKEIPCFWMEVEVKVPKEPMVTTRILAEETKDGPGELFGVIVQVEGHKPFKVPAKYYKGDDSKVSDFETIKTEGKAEQKDIEWKGKTISAYEVESVDEKGQKTKAVVSEQIPPLCVISIETSEIKMALENWGMDAKTKIKGSPLSFYYWLLIETGKGLLGQ